MSETGDPEHGPAPGPAGDLVTGNLKEFRRDPLRFLLEARREHGDVVRFRMGPYLAHLVSHPAGIRHVLVTDAENYHKAAAVRGRAPPLVGRGLLTSEGDFWRRQRKLAQPAFHLDRINAFGARMTDAIEAMLARWRGDADSGRPIDVAPEMADLTLTILSRTLFGTDIGDDVPGVGAALTVALRRAAPQRRMSLLPLLEALPTPANLEFRRAAAALDRVVYRLIDERRRSGDEGGDLLSMLVFARDEETGEAMSDRQLRDEVMTFFIAGHETTANALAWTWYLLAKNPPVERRLHAELDEVLDGRLPTVGDLPRLRYTLMVLQESMRLYPPAWMLARTPLADDRIGGYRIPARSIVVMSQYVTHRHPDFWEQPEGFDPERFAEPPPAAYFPFGRGPRACIGGNFALVEARLVLATVAQRYRLELVPGHPVEPEPLVTLRPRSGVVVTLRRRRRTEHPEPAASPSSGAAPATEKAPPGGR